MNWDALLNETFWINMAIVVGITLVSYLVLRTILGIVTRRLNTLASRSKTPFLGIAAELLARTSRLLILAFSLLIALKAVELPERWESTMSHGWFIALAFQIALWMDTGVRLWMESLTRDGKARNPVTTTIIGIMIRIVVWTMMLLSILANLGVDITAMVASLGVGGIAIALAVQTLLSDVFASLSIGVDKPFEIGDFVVFGEVAGTIEHIGLKTTRIRALSGEQIVISNADLLRQIVHNYKRMNTRRIVFKFGITYNTPSEKVKDVAALVKRIIDGIEIAKFDRAHFLGFDDSQLTFEVVYIMQVSDYNRYMDTQQEINLALLDGIRGMGVQFAFPTRSVEFIGGRLPEVTVAGLPREESAPTQDAPSSQPPQDAQPTA
ncbi:mechanosensitive ion channel protein MscS [Stutzerimonas stutzeri]|uniref:Mechanosensitive ion channel protein MscS n=1 Tax=Stutzerimonas stutzeri TaxID=316 RepID=A0A2N8SQ24_STUST|nr:mechanosensitive ion channel family protein [Stutzerimonas stutzeri]MCQ4326509.1 mechanosensitive ion channel family protein [Stutzerimonas stutzeri]PNG04579.1 mechanosensitive ion channel protein MscS [Stutzerimonas stutzeri]